MHRPLPSLDHSDHTEEGEGIARKCRSDTYSRDNEAAEARSYGPSEIELDSIQCQGSRQLFLVY
jgi:hypothetical protein